LVFKVGFDVVKTNKSITWVKQGHKPPIWEWFMPPIKMAIWGMVYDIVLPANQAIPNRGL
jgi:hypothetical protein